MPSPAASRRNLENARQRGQIKRRRCSDESKIIKSLAWQSWWDSDRPPSQRQLARRLGVSQPYIHKLLQKARTVGMNQILKDGCVTLGDLEEARRLTARVRERAPALFAPASTSASVEPEPQPSNPYRVMADSRTLQEWEELERRGRRRVLFSVPVR